MGYCWELVWVQRHCNRAGLALGWQPVGDLGDGDLDVGRIGGRVCELVDDVLGLSLVQCHWAVECQQRRVAGGRRFDGVAGAKPSNDRSEIGANPRRLRGADAWWVWEVGPQVIARFGCAVMHG